MESEKTKEQKDEAKKLVEGEKKKAIEMRESNGEVQSNRKATRRNKRMKGKRRKKEEDQERQ